MDPLGARLSLVADHLFKYQSLDGLIVVRNGETEHLESRSLKPAIRMIMIPIRLLLLPFKFIANLFARVIGTSWDPNKKVRELIAKDVNAYLQRRNEGNGSELNDVRIHRLYTSCEKISRLQKALGFGIDLKTELPPRTEFSKLLYIKPDSESDVEGEDSERNELNRSPVIPHNRSVELTTNANKIGLPPTSSTSAELAEATPDKPATMERRPSGPPPVPDVVLAPRPLSDANFGTLTIETMKQYAVLPEENEAANAAGPVAPADAPPTADRQGSPVTPHKEPDSDLVDEAFAPAAPSPLRLDTFSQETQQAPAAPVVHQESASPSADRQRMMSSHSAPPPSPFARALVASASAQSTAETAVEKQNRIYVSCRAAMGLLGKSREIFAKLPSSLKTVVCAADRDDVKAVVGRITAYTETADEAEYPVIEGFLKSTSLATYEKLQPLMKSHAGVDLVTPYRWNNKLYDLSEFVGKIPPYGAVRDYALQQLMEAIHEVRLLNIHRWDPIEWKEFDTDERRPYLLDCGHTLPLCIGREIFAQGCGCPDPNCGKVTKALLPNKELAQIVQLLKSEEQGA